MANFGKADSLEKGSDHMRVADGTSGKKLGKACCVRIQADYEE